MKINRLIIKATDLISRIPKDRWIKHDLKKVLTYIFRLSIFDSSLHLSFFFFFFAFLSRDSPKLISGRHFPEIHFRSSLKSKVVHSLKANDKHEQWSLEMTELWVSSLDFGSEGFLV